MQLFKKLSGALDTVDNGGKGNTAVDGLPIALQSSSSSCASREARGEEMSPPIARVVAVSELSIDGEKTTRADDAFAEEAARVLRSAATAAEALAPRLSLTIQRAEAAEAEVSRLRSILDTAEARVKELEKQQDSLAKSFIKEIEQRDAEIATFKASASSIEACSSKSPQAHTLPEGDGSEAIEIITFTDEGKLGIEFDETYESLKIVKYVAPSSQSEGRLFVGDEVISVSGVRTQNLSWQDMIEILSARPVVVSVRRAEARGGSKPSNPFLKTIAGWTRALAARNTKDTENNGGIRAPEDDNLEVCNRPFFELVRGSISEAVAANSSATDFSQEEQFEQWLRQFHNERDDEWYASNHIRLINAFKPIWDEVLDGHRALVATHEFFG